MNKYQVGDFIYLKPFKWNKEPWGYIILKIKKLHGQNIYDICEIIPVFGRIFYDQDIHNRFELYSHQEYKKDYDI